MIHNGNDDLITSPIPHGLTYVGPPRWNHTAVSVFAVPYWKIFVFGGNSGDLNDSNVNPQGTYLSDLCVYETGQNMWSNPQVVGQLPGARSDTEMVRRRTHTSHVIIIIIIIITIIIISCCYCCCCW